MEISCLPILYIYRLEPTLGLTWDRGVEGERNGEDSNGEEEGDHNGDHSGGDISLNRGCGNRPGGCEVVCEVGLRGGLSKKGRKKKKKMFFFIISGVNGRSALES